MHRSASADRQTHRAVWAKEQEPMRLMRNGLVCLAAAAALAGCGLDGEEPTPLTDRELGQSGSRFETPTVVGSFGAVRSHAAPVTAQ